MTCTTLFKVNFFKNTDMVQTNIVRKSGFDTARAMFKDAGKEKFIQLFVLYNMAIYGKDTGNKDSPIESTYIKTTLEMGRQLFGLGKEEILKNRKTSAENKSEYRKNAQNIQFTDTSRYIGMINDSAFSELIQKGLATDKSPFESSLIPNGKKYYLTKKGKDYISERINTGLTFSTPINNEELEEIKEYISFFNKQSDIIKKFNWDIFNIKKLIPESKNDLPTVYNVYEIPLLREKRRNYNDIIKNRLFTKTNIKTLKDMYDLEKKGDRLKIEDFPKDSHLLKKHGLVYRKKKNYCLSTDIKMILLENDGFKQPS